MVADPLMLDRVTLQELGESANLPGHCRTFQFDNAVRKAFWEPETSVRIIGVVKTPGSSVACVIAKTDLTAAQLAAIPAGSQLGTIIFVDNASTFTSVFGLDVLIDAGENEKVYLNWATTSVGQILVYYRPG